MPFFLRDEESDTKKGGRGKKSNREGCRGGEGESKVVDGRVESDSKEDKGGKKGEFINNIETVVFLPTTLRSVLKKKLQEMEDCICKATNFPYMRFVERGGPTVMETVGKSNP